MEYLRNKLVQTNHEDYGEGNPHQNVEGEKTIVIHPGEVEEAIHMVTVPGMISLEELRFWSYVPDPHVIDDSQSRRDYPAEADIVGDPDEPNEIIINKTATNQEQYHHQRETQDAYIDIVVFEIPVHCSSDTKPCDLPSYGIGTIFDDIDGQSESGIPQPRLSLCNETTGRLSIHPETFHGYYTTLHIPPVGYLMKDRITDPRAHKIPSFPSRDSQYEILIANCDTGAYGTGRNIELSGQILFEYDPSMATGLSSQEPGYHRGANDSPFRYHIGTIHQDEEYGGNLLLDGLSQLKLFAVAFSICVFFSMISCRIQRGTRSDYFNGRRRQRYVLNDNNNNNNNYNENDNETQNYSDDSGTEGGQGE